MTADENYSVAYLQGVHPYAYRTGEKAQILGVKNFVPGGLLNPRFVYEIAFDDGEIDYVPISEVAIGHWRML